MEEVKVQVNFNTRLLNAVLKNIETGGSTTVDQTEMDEELTKLFPIQTQNGVWKREDKLKEEDMANKMVPIHILMNFKGDFTSFFSV